MHWKLFFIIEIHRFFSLNSFEMIFFYKYALEMIFKKNASEMNFTIKMHWKLFCYKNVLAIYLL